MNMDRIAHKLDTHDHNRTGTKHIGRFAGFVKSLPHKHLTALRDLVETELREREKKKPEKSPSKMTHAEFEQWLTKETTDGQD